ncbi:hypothetical protein B0H10DRAFT_2186722 [Mycena sp. CBHHK59/15]|nr:hypothetical protein B0H10DRAFT_2186722 [Mycena sp. CBHHK59/15]
MSLVVIQTLMTGFPNWDVMRVWSETSKPLTIFVLAALVSADEYKQLKDFMYIDSTEALGSFSQFIGGLGIKKIQVEHTSRPLGQHTGSEFPSNFDWSAFTPPQELPTLPPRPASSPLAYAEHMEPLADVSAQTRRPRQEVDEKNIIHSKWQRTLSTRAADAAAVERPKKKSKRSRSCTLN